MSADEREFLRLCAAVDAVGKSPSVRPAGPRQRDRRARRCHPSGCAHRVTGSEDDDAHPVIA